MPVDSFSDFTCVSLEGFAVEAFKAGMSGSGWSCETLKAGTDLMSINAMGDQQLMDVDLDAMIRVCCLEHMATAV